MRINKLPSISILFILFILASCQLVAAPSSPPGGDQGRAPTRKLQAAAQAAATPTPTAESTPTSGIPFPPLVLQTSPEQGAEVDLDTPIEISFDQPMERDSVEAAFLIEPETAGRFAWEDDQTLRFTPNQDYERGQRYEVTLTDTATSAAGVPLNREFEMLFNTVGFLEVTTVQPEDGAGEIAPDTTVTVLFNRPVVPLSATEDQGRLPDPLTFVPPVAGQGEWLNTSIYQFTPDEGFEPATEYTARVAAGLTDLKGGTLEDDFTWTFRTASPGVVATYPESGAIYVSPTPVISVAFNQLMDRESVEKAFRLTAVNTDESIPGTFTWVEAGLTQPRDPYEYYYYQEGEGPPAVGVETVGFTPDEPLELGTFYEIVIEPSAKGRQGARSYIGKAYVSNFQTVPELEVVRTSPRDGAENVRYYNGLEITFSAPVSPASIVVGKNLLIDPSVAVTQVYTYFWDSNTSFSLNFPTEPSSAYTVTLLESIESRYGQPLSEEATIRWKTSAREPTLFLHAPGFENVGTYSAYTPTLVFVTVNNISAVDFALYDLPEEDFIRLNGENRWEAKERYRPDPDNLIRTWQIETAPVFNYSAIYGTNLAEEKDGVLEPGLYYLVVSADRDNIYPEAQTLPHPSSQKQIVVVSNHNLTLKTAGSESLAWLTDLQTGEPVAGAPIRFHSERDKLAEGITDELGVATGEHRRFDPWMPRFVFSDDPFAAAINYWSEGIERWQFGLSSEDFLAPYNAYFYTDRPLYRPGQTVYFKGILRQDDDARYTLPPRNVPVNIRIFDAQGKEIYADQYRLNENGTLHGEIELAEEAALGFYTIEARYEDQFFSGSFQVAEFRKPEFIVEVATDKAEYANGETIQLTAQANFFFGGPLANAEVRYSVLSEDSFFNYTGPGGYYDFTDYDFSRAYDTFFPGFGELIDEGTGSTDADGSFVLEVPADISDRTNSQRFTLEVSVTDPDSNQVVANRASVTVHKGDYYIGLRPQRYVSTAGDETGVDILTVDWQSQPSPNQELTVVFSEHKWFSVQVLGEDGRYYWESQVETTPILTTTATTDAGGKAEASFTPPNGGIFRVEAQGTDTAGNIIRSSTFMWVSGGEFVNWRQENNDRLELVTDKREYNVGDVATVLIPHPYSDTVTALVTQERGHIYDYDLYTLETNSEQIEIPITEDMIPNMFVSVIIVQEPDTNNSIASFKVGYAQLPINVQEKEINITLTPDKPAGETYQPGETITYDILATDHEGNPVEAEFSLALVDKAILSLAGDTGRSLLEYFWRERGLGVGTATTLAISADRLNLILAPEAKGGGGGGFEEAFSVVRGDFRDTAYWVADFTTDAEGHGSVTTTLPDNLTTWVLTARGITQDTLVGDEQVEIVSTKPVLVRPVAPRFFVVGDEAELRMVVQNNTKEELEIETLFEGEGVTLTTGQAREEMTLAAGDQATLTYPVKVLTADEAVLRFGAKAEAYEDAVEVALPIHRHSTPETVGTAGLLVEDGRRLEGIALPSSFDPTQGDLIVKIEPSLASGMRSGLTYLEHFPYECSEQTVSRFLPNVVTYRAYQALKLDDPELAKRLPGLVSTGLQRLYTQQNLDGGWGWWTNDESNPFLSAYVILGMVEAKQAGFAVDDDVFEQGINFLSRSLRRPTDVQQPWHANRQAFVLYVLAEAGFSDMSRTVSLFDQRDKLDIYGRAYLAMAFHLIDPTDIRITTLINDISGGAIVSATGAHWEEAQPDFYNMNTDTRSTAIVLTALSRLDPNNALAPNAVRWLMAVRENDRWETTQETAWSIIGLTDWMVATGELEGNYAWEVSLNGEDLGQGTVEASNIDETTTLTVAVADLLADEINRLIIERAPQDQAAESLGRLYYTTHLEYFKPVEEVKALDRGIVVARQYTLAEQEQADEETPAPAITGARVGDIITVRLTIIAPHDLHYVVLEDPIPAGTEAIDVSLATTSVVNEGPELVRQRGRGWGWWWFNHTELRDEKAVLFATYLPRGTYEYTYQIRASLSGEYRVLPTHAEEMYFPEVFGRGDGGVFTITE